MHKSIIPEQIVENPNFKPLLVVKEWPTFCGFCAAPNIFACILLSLQKKLIKCKQASANIFVTNATSIYECGDSKFLTIKFI